jgi:hypothetical protein
LSISSLLTNEAVEKVLFNRKAHKVGAKHTKVRYYISALCVLSDTLCDLCGYWILLFNQPQTLKRKLKANPINELEL